MLPCSDLNRAAYVSSIIRQTQSHVQLVPIARLLTSGDFTEQELRTIIPAYAAVFRSKSRSVCQLNHQADSVSRAISAYCPTPDQWRLHGTGTQDNYSRVCCRVPI